jgi:hypothetical protein
VTTKRTPTKSDAERAYQRGEIRRLNAERRRLKGKDWLEGPEAKRRVEQRAAEPVPTRTASRASPTLLAERPKRLSLSQIVEGLLARGAREHSSVTISRNARGIPQFEVSVRTGDSEDVPDANAAYRKACELYDALDQKYPFNGNEA